MFNNETGSDLTLEQFVATGDDEVPAYLTVFGLRGPGERAPDDRRDRLWHRSDDLRVHPRVRHGHRRATSTPGSSSARHETVGRFGKVERLRTIHVADGQTLDLPDDSTDVAFSYITLQHCDADDALDLTSEAVRITRPGGKIALNYRGRTRIRRRCCSRSAR